MAALITRPSDTVVENAIQCDAASRARGRYKRARAAEEMHDLIRILCLQDLLVLC